MRRNYTPEQEEELMKFFAPEPVINEEEVARISADTRRTVGTATSTFHQKGDPIPDIPSGSWARGEHEPIDLSGARIR